MGWSWPALGELRDAQGHDGSKSPHIPIPWPPRHSSLPVLSLIHMLKPPHLLPSLLIPDFSEPLLSPTLNSSLPTTCYSLLHPPYTFPEGHLCGSGPWSPSVPPELFYSTPNYKQFPVPREAPPMKPGLSWARNNKEQQAVQPPMPEAMEERGAHHKQLAQNSLLREQGKMCPMGKCWNVRNPPFCSGTGTGWALPEATQSLRGKGRC